MRRALFLSAVVSVLLLLPGGSGMHCNGDVTTIPVGPETLYVEHRPEDSVFGAAEDVFIYLESNKMPGLQSGGDRLIPEECQVPIPVYCFNEYCDHRPADIRLYPGP